MTPPSRLRDPNLTPLARKLAGRIVSAGPITLHDYMEACLYDPDHGYYRVKAGIGQRGDFITAPEISQVFGELIGLWAAEVWRQMGEPAAVRLIELGPGRGALMADALRALRVAPLFLKSARVHLIEASAPLMEAQRGALSGVPAAVSWHKDLGEVPAGPAILIANEFFDCLPVRQFVFDGGRKQWRERMVAFEDGAFRFALDSADGTPAPLAPGLPPVEHGEILEQRCVRSVMEAIAARTPFAALIIDYGYALPSLGDTVQAVRRHRFTDLFDAPGETDLTAHVDFLHLKQAAANANLKAFGPMPMGEWLLRLGLEARLGQLLSRASRAEARDIHSRAARLVDPVQMGALFKVLALTNGISTPPPPFVAGTG
jgi:SAM-dependent MidA family methyltransferase